MNLDKGSGGSLIEEAFTVCEGETMPAVNHPT